MKTLGPARLALFASLFTTVVKGPAFGQNGVPSLQSLTPSSATAGGPAFTLTVNGSGFVGELLNSAVVEWNGAVLSTSYISSTQLTANVPATLIATAGVASVTVVDPGGATSNAVTFTINPGSTSTPVLAGLSPSTAAPGGSAFTLTINGSGFVTGSSVLWNGSALSTGFVSGVQLTAFVPANLIASPGSASVTVTNPGGFTSNTLTFTIITPGTPSLVSLSPNSATAGGSGFTLTVNGSGFVSGSAVQWSGTTLSTGFISGNQVSAFVPATLIAVPGTAVVSVVNPGGINSNTLTFTITSVSAPALSSLSPSSAVSGGAGFTLLVSGSGFANGAAVEWNGSALSTGFISANQLSAFVPASFIVSPGSASITVVNPGGSTSNTLSFAIVASTSPTLSSLAPNTTSAGGPTFSLTVTGAGFLNGAVVQWNGTALSTGFISANQLGTTVPASLIASPGTASVTVTNPGGAISNSLAFTITAGAAPALISLSPNSAGSGGATFTLSVTGSGFVNGAVIEWNGAPLATGFVSSTQLSAIVPAALIANAGTAVVSVLNPSGVATNALTFTIFSFSSSSLRIAQIADGSNWQTEFQVINLDQVPVTFSFNFWDDSGNPLPLPIVNGVAGTFSGSLPVGGTAFASTPGTSAALLQGWAEAASSGRIGVLTIFRQSVPGVPTAEGTVTGVQSGDRIFLPFDDTNGYVTGVAIANTNPGQTLFISLTFQLENGSQMTGSLSLPPRAHTAFELTSLFPALANVRGSVEVTSATPDLAVVGLRFSPTNSFTSLGQFQ